MKRISFPAVVSAALALTCALASHGRCQGPLPVLRLGESVTGRLSASDPALSQGGRVRIYQIEARQGTVYAAVLRSDAFEGRLVLGQRLHGITDYPLVWTELRQPAPGVTRLLFSPPRSGTFLVLVQSIREEGTGSFTLSLETTTPPRGGPPPTVGLPLGETRGALAAGDTRHPDDPSRFVDHYSFPASPGRRVRITARSAVRPLVVEVGGRPSTGFKTLGRASADGVLNFTAPAIGHWYVRVISPPGVTGEYTLTLEDRPEATWSASADGSSGR